MLKKTIKKKINTSSNKKKNLIKNKSKKNFKKKNANKKTRKILNNVNDRKTKKIYNKLVGGAGQLVRVGVYQIGQTLTYFNMNIVNFRNSNAQYLTGDEYIVVTTLAMSTHIILIGEQSARDIENFMSNPLWRGVRPVDRARLFSSLEMDEEIEEYIRLIFPPYICNNYFTLHRNIVGDIKRAFPPVRIRHDFSLLILLIEMFAFFIYGKKLVMPGNIYTYLRNLYPNFIDNKPLIDIIHPANRISTDIGVVERLVNQVKYYLTSELDMFL